MSIPAPPAGDPDTNTENGNVDAQPYDQERVGGSRLSTSDSHDTPTTTTSLPSSDRHEQPAKPRDPELFEHRNARLGDNWQPSLYHNIRQRIKHHGD
ncbi:uncharacterized protein Z519_02361 [Cladophialophora bantiana CBS 173.52]|uniref:Uncharacterized protein n=1 Tax=Cladophialophora bantiana (strain ATCC 10958 / CBS 173.52 / CDC B-1940 / NIH 8579) TaxID=1442370 RepID=A0A0D2I1D0_CLAB1|nr:uncharacterized protein Z519_02361 [Cladophialophora bantiana CBS 173.52]KIW96970.1 hypothetical protein Z519_02361 [Cladophialophora bantiana CBS 173.52]